MSMLELRQVCKTCGQSLIRSETARDLRTLAATGASGATRRTITPATADALGLLGAVLGTVCGYVAALGFSRTSQLNGLSSPASIPVANLLIILVGMPLLSAGCWAGGSRPAWPPAAGVTAPGNSAAAGQPRPGGMPRSRAR